MSAERTIQLLNRLLQIEYRSFAMYLFEARPWSHSGDEKSESLLRNMLTDQKHMAERIAKSIGELGGTVEAGEFPMEFTDTHLLSLDYLMKELLRYQAADIARIEQVVAQLHGNRAAQELAQEALGLEKAHLEALQELAVQPA